MVIAIVSNEGKFFFNLHAHVGTGKTNRLDDVDLVRLAYHAIRQGKSETAQKTIKAMGTALTNCKPSGPFGPDLDAAIRAHQAVRGGTQDGCISPAKGVNGTSSMRYDSAHIYMIVPLNNNILDIMSGNYPRLDKHPQCGASLRQTCQAMFVR